MKDEVAEALPAFPDTIQGTSSWLRILAREVNTYVLFMHTWSAMGFVVSPGLIESLLQLQDRVTQAREAVSALGPHGDLDRLGETLQDIAGQEETVFRAMMEEIKKFKDETEDLFPAFKLNFDPCF